MIENLAQIITWGVCSLIVVIFLSGVYARMAAYRGKRPFGELGKVAPTLVTTLGVLGTFVGIYLGLINFNTSNIDVSIPLLLEGLKTAFITSIFGMAAYLALNFVYKRYDGKEASAEDANSEDPVVLLRKIAAELAGLTTETKASRLGIAKCITSDDDASMKSQLKLVRDDLNTFKQEVATGFDAFSVKVGQQMGDAMVNGLREIVDQFHARLNEMIGAEFRQLKDAMLKLVEWQENYRISVDAMQAQLKTCMEQVNSASGLLVGTSDATRAAGEQLDRIKGSLSGITTSTQDIAQHLESLKLQNAQLATLIQGVRIIGEEAKTVLPSIAEHLNGTTRVLQDSAGATGQQLVQATTALKTAVEGAIATMNESSLRHSRQVDAYLEKLESNLQETLTESLDVLVVKLASLSSRFAEDYTPLANKLREIVQIAEGVNGYQSTGVAQ